MEQYLVVSALVVAVVGVVKDLEPKLSGHWTVLLAVVVGAVLGYVGVEGLGVQQGVVAALSAVGVVKVADRVAGK